MTELTEKIDELKEELLFDVVCAAPENVVLNPAEKRIMEMVTRALTGGVVMWFSLQQLLSEVAEYRSFRRKIKGPED